MEKNLVMEQHGPETIKYDNAHKALQKMCIANYADESLQTNGSKNIHRVNLAEGNRIENALMFYQHKIRAKKFDLF